MSLESADRPSDSPYIERVWEGGDLPGATHLHSVANSNWELVVWQHRGETRVTVRGPETAPTLLELSQDPDFRAFGIVFSHGASMRHLPVPRLVDRELDCPYATPTVFVLADDEWEVPRYDNAEVFVERLVREGLLVRDPLVSDVLTGDSTPSVSSRSVQRRVVTATGLTHGTIRQIERARWAAILLGQGLSPGDVVHRAGYYDQPHMARSLRRYIGRTGTQLQVPDTAHALSLLYKTDTAVRS